MNFVMNNRYNGGDDDREPKGEEKIAWYHWIPFFGYFLPSYPCYKIGLDIWHSIWVFATLLLFASMI